MSSDFSYPKPIFTSPIYNPAFYLTLDASGYLTYDYAQTLYLDKNDYRLTYITGITQGTATQGIVLVPGTNNDISGIGALSCSSLTVNDSSVSSPPSYVVGITPGTAANNKALILGASGEIGTISSLTATNIYGTLQTGSQTAITAVGTLSNLTLSTAGTGLQIPNLKFWNATSSLYDNFNHSYYIGVSLGGAVGGKALVVDSSLNIGSIATFNAENINGSVSVSGLLGDFGGLNINSTLVITSSRNIVNVGTITSSGITDSAGFRISGSYVIDGSRNILAASISGTISTAAQPNITSLGKQTLLRATRGEFEVASGTTGNGSAAYNTYPLVIVNDSDTIGTIAGLSFMIDSSAGSANSYAPSAAIAALRVAGSYASADLKFFTRTGGSASDPITERMVITQGGRVGIAAGAPESKFHVVGDTSILYGSWVRTFECWNGHTTPMKAGLIMYNQAGGSNDQGLSWGTFTNDPLRWFVNGSNGMEFNTSKRLNIDRISGPEGNLHAGGEIWADEHFHCKGNASEAYYRWQWGLSNYPAIGNDATSGSMRIGTYNASFAWQSYMPIRAGSFTNASDLRIKKDVVELSYGLNEVMRMKPKRFAMRSDDSLYVGFIAQEMLDIIPECVSGVESPDDEMNDAGEPCNPMGIDLASLVSVLTKAIQELNQEVDELRAIISE